MISILVLLLKVQIMVSIIVLILLLLELFQRLSLMPFSDEDENNIQDRSGCSGNESDSDRLDLSYSADSSQFEEV